MDFNYTNKSLNIPVFNQPFQASVLVFIMLISVVANGLVILNISRDSLKLKMVHFILIRHVCITDSIGAMLVLPTPLISFIRGAWDWSYEFCILISTTTACCWTMHLVAVALYRADRVFAIWLPVGKYPVFHHSQIHVILVVIWCMVIMGSVLATYTFKATFQPALCLCIPNVPLLFFIVVFSCYCVGLITIISVYVILCVRSSVCVGMKTRVLASYSVSIGHLILYLPAMLIVGVIGGTLPNVLAFTCGTIVYSEFIIQPIALLLVSPKLSHEAIFCK